TGAERKRCGRDRSSNHDRGRPVPDYALSIKNGPEHSLSHSPLVDTNNPVPALVAPARKGVRKMIRTCSYSVAIAFLAVFSVMAQEPREIVAKVDGENISAQDLREAAGALLARLEDETYRVKQQKLQSLIEDKLLAHEARRRNVSLESL